MNNKANLAFPELKYWPDLLKKKTEEVSDTKYKTKAEANGAAALIHG
jgi:hypothetical protein